MTTINPDTQITINAILDLRVKEGMNYDEQVYEACLIAGIPVLEKFSSRLRRFRDAYGNDAASCIVVGRAGRAVQIDDIPEDAKCIAAVGGGDWWRQYYVAPTNFGMLKAIKNLLAI